MFRDGTAELFMECIDLFASGNQLDLRIVPKMDAGSVLEFIEGGLFAFAPLAPFLPMILVRLNRYPKTLGFGVGAWQLPLFERLYLFQRDC